MDSLEVNVKAIKWFGSTVRECWVGIVFVGAVAFFIVSQ
jgi:hypothetical protein